MCKPNGRTFESYTRSQIYSRRVFLGILVDGGQAEALKMANTRGKRLSPQAGLEALARPKRRVDAVRGQLFSDSQSRAAGLVYCRKTATAKFPACCWTHFTPSIQESRSASWSVWTRIYGR